MVSTRQQKQRCLVTGGSGFLGKHLVQQLLDTEDCVVTVFDIRAGADERASTIVGDLRNRDQVLAACQGIDVVYHCATAAPSASNAISNEKLMYDVNIVGTENIIWACQQLSISKLVYTSSASVVFEGRDLLDVDETAPYASKPMDFYTNTKVKGEMLIRAANGIKGVSTVSLRPSGIFGEGDPLLVPITVDKAKAGKMKFMIGDGTNLMDFTYVGNVALAHIMAAKALSTKPSVAGQAYFITNDDAQPFWRFLGDFLEPLGYGRPRIKLPFYPILMLAIIFEYLIMPLCKMLGKPLPASEFTTTRIRIAACNRRFNITRAKEELGYKPTFDVKTGLQRTIASFSYLKADNSK